MRIVVTSSGTLEFRDMSPRKSPRQVRLFYDRHKSPEIREPKVLKPPTIVPSSKVKSVDLNLKKLSIPPNMLEKYIYNPQKKEDEQEPEEGNNFFPDVLLSISKSMDSSGSSSKLPTIKNSYPLRYIIAPENYEKLKRDIQIRKEEQLKKSKQVIGNNFRTSVQSDPNIEFSRCSRREIGANNRNLIEYLNTDSTISSSYLEKLAKYDDNRIRKLNKICQKAFYYRNQEEMIRGSIKKKLKNEISNEGKYCEERLREMKNDLEGTQKIIDVDYPKFNKRDRYLIKYRDVERNWEIYNTARYYKKSAPPKIVKLN